MKISGAPTESVVTWQSDVARRVGGLGGSLPRRVTAAERARARGAPPRTLQSASAGPRRAKAQTRTHTHMCAHTHTHTRSHAYTRAHTRVCHTRTHTPAQEGSERVHSLSGPRDAPRETWPSDSSPVAGAHSPPGLRVVRPADEFLGSAPRARPAVRPLESTCARAHTRARSGWARCRRRPAQPPSQNEPQASQTGDRCRMQKKKKSF